MKPPAAKPPDIRIARNDVLAEDAGEAIDGRQMRTTRRWRVRSPLLTLQRRGAITDLQCRAGERFAACVERAAIGVQSQLNPDRLNGVRGGGNPTVGILATAETATHYAAMVSQALRAMGPDNGRVVEAVAIHGEAADAIAVALGYQPREGVTLLRAGLNALAAHWLMEGPTTP